MLTRLAAHLTSSAAQKPRHEGKIDVRSKSKIKTSPIISTRLVHHQPDRSESKRAVFKSFIAECMHENQNTSGALALEIAPV